VIVLERVDFLEISVVSVSVAVMFYCENESWLRLVVKTTLAGSIPPLTDLSFPIALPLPYPAPHAR
jgi:hypothetical protein